MKRIGIIGIGKLGLCFALNLENKNFEVVGIDVSEDYVSSLVNKTFVSDEPHVNEYLSLSKRFYPTTDYSKLDDVDMVFVLVPTPSLPDGTYDHTYIEEAVKNLREKSSFSKKLIVGCTTMPGYCDHLQERVEVSGLEIYYNPEFIAQGTIMRDQLFPDMVLIGTPKGKEENAHEIVELYDQLVDNSPRFEVMSAKEAEIAKIALNCFLTTKIAYANMVGDVALASNVSPDKILGAIGADSRIGNKYLKYGYGFGGPCFPRDNRAFGIHAENVGINARISKATDDSNADHLKCQFENYMKMNLDYYLFSNVTYKPESSLLIESQQLAIAVLLADAGKRVRITERPNVIKQLKQLYGNKFEYAERDC